jgi:hypothetical protein
LVKVPPAKTSPVAASYAIALTAPLEIWEAGELTALQALPFQLAMRSAPGTPPAAVKVPPA